MSEKMTKDERQMAREMLDAATQAPWVWMPDDHDTFAFLHSYNDESVLAVQLKFGISEADAKLIAAAPALLGKALDQIDKLEKSLDQLRIEHRRLLDTLPYDD